MPLIVIKKDGTRQQFDRAKVQAGMIKACEKRPIPLERIAQAVGEIEASLRNEEPSSEVTSARVGEKVMEKLRELDDVAYIRFASVYKEFDDAKKFAEVVAMLSGEDREANHNPKRSSKRSSAEKRTSLVAPARRKEKLRKPITSQQDKH
jgi:transcriptional repressor NrdR